MDTSSPHCTVKTDPGSSPDPGLLGPGIMSIFRRQERVAGVDAADALIQAMLFGMGMARTRLSWKLHEPKSPPQVGRCSATLVLQDDDCPLWLRMSLHQPLALQERLNELSRQQFLNQPSPARVRQAQDRAKMLRDWMPQTPATIMWAAQARRRPQNVDFLLNIPARGWFKQTHSVFGGDRLLLLRGSKDYERLIKHREVPPFLQEMESGGNAWPHVTFNGWLKHEALIHIIRTLDAESAGRLGWLTPVGGGRPQAEGDPDHDHVIDALFYKMTMLRLGRSHCLSPPPEIADRIEAATADLRSLLGTQPAHLHPLGLHDNQLVWQIAALLTFLAKEKQDELSDHELHEVVDAAAGIAGRIVAAHLNVLRQALPSGRSTDALARPIVDRLTKGPAKLRELVRSFKKIRTDEVEVSLQRLAHDGVATRIDGDRWAFVRVPLPDLSAILSESVVRPGRPAGSTSRGTDITDTAS